MGKKKPSYEPEKLGDYEKLGEMCPAGRLTRDILANAMSDYLRDYGRHPVLYGRAIEPRGSDDETIREYAEWFARELFVALDWAGRTARGEDVNRVHAVEAHE